METLIDKNISKEGKYGSYNVDIVNIYIQLLPTIMKNHLE